MKSTAFYTATGEKVTINTIVNISELKATRGNKSYYGKANVIRLSNGVILLQSYDTIVCGINTKHTFCKVWNGYSATTQKHIDDFIRQYLGGNGLGKKEWEEMPINKAFCKRYQNKRIAANYRIEWY